MTLGQAIASTRPQDKNAIYADSTLTDKLLSQIYKATARCSRIYFAPDGMLHLLAMENMDGAPGGGDRMCRLTSTRELLRTDKRSGQGALLVGGLSYDDCDATPYPTNASPDRTAATTLSRLQAAACRAGRIPLPAVDGHRGGHHSGDNKKNVEKHKDRTPKGNRRHGDGLQAHD